MDLTYIFCKFVKTTITLSYTFMKKHMKIYITGKVQKVGFRFYAMQAAYRYGVLGFAKNQLDGSVYLEVEGKAKAIHDFIEWCKNGPPGSVVSDVKLEEGEIKDYTEFEIR